MSVLLDALKKAALEKKQRDESTQKSFAAPPKIERVTPDAKHQPSMIAINDELPEDTAIDSSEEEVLSIDVDFDALDKDEATEISETSSSDSVLALTDLEFDNDNRNLSDYSKPKTLEVKHATTQEEESTAVNSKNELAQPIEPPITHSKNKSTSGPEAVTEPKPEHENSSENVNVNHDSQKQAFATLLEKNRKQEKIKRIKFITLLVSLSIVVIALSSNYYIYTKLDTPTHTTASGQHNTENNSSDYDDNDLNSISEPELNGSTEVQNHSSMSKDTNTQITSTTEVKSIEKSIKNIQETAEKKIIQPQKLKPKKPQQVNSDVKKSVQQSNSVTRSTTTPSALNLALSEAYSAYRQGDSKRAEEQYRIAMELAPNNTDALLGSAAVAMTLQRYHQALSFYQKVLEKSPQDEYAQSGILSLAAIEQVTPELVSRVNILIKQFPNSSHLYFLQGSLHAIAQQWHAAQTSFFNAWSRQPKRSDYAYNLAIALDHIQQYKEALRFYKQSLSSDMESPILLNGNDIQQRIQQLEAMNE